MIRLPAGKPRFLLTHHSEVLRNTERAKTGTPVAVVVEVDDTGKPSVYHGYNVLVNGPVSLEYSQRTPLFVTRMSPAEEDMKVYAAYGTTHEVVLAETPDESLDDTYAGDVEKPQATPKPESTKKK